MKSSARAGIARVQLDREQILAAALELARTETPITIRALGTQLGADPTALYRHFRTRGEVVLATFDKLLAKTFAGIDPEAPWREKLTGFSLDFWECCINYPTICAEIRGTSSGGPGELRAVELHLECLGQAGLDRAGAVRYYGLISGYVLSVGSKLADEKLKEIAAPDTAASTWLGDLATADPRHFPQIAASRAELAELKGSAIYPMGLEVILDAAAAEGNRP